MSACSTCAGRPASRRGASCSSGRASKRRSPSRIGPTETSMRAPADDGLERTWTQSLAALAALRLRWTGSGMIPAAGLPWFMTLFGRDTLITSLQELLVGPEPAAASLRALAEAQADVDDPE